MSNHPLFFSERLLHSFIFKAISTALIISIFLLQTGIVSFAEEAASSGESSGSTASSTDTGTTGDTTTGGDGGGGTDGTGTVPGIESMSAMGGGSLLSNLAQSYLPTTFQTDFFTGKANLAIPVAVPPGRRNLQPNLSFNYTSGNPNSWVGIGWDMSLGSISRSTKNGPPKYDSTDTFILGLGGGGVELVNIGGTEYRAKQENAFLKIVQSGTYWEVTDKAGTKYLFGFYGSYSSNASGTYKWYLDKVIDVQGNYVKVTYVIDYGQLYPQFIDYTGNETTGLLPTNKVQFFLELRNDIEFDYRSGYQIQMRFRLLRIDITTSGSLVRSYKPNYIYIGSTGRTQLTSLVQYGEDGVSALPTTGFSYQTKDNAVIASGTWLAGWLAGFTGTSGNVIQGDFNRDALTDVGIYDAPNGNWLVAKNKDPMPFILNQTTNGVGGTTNITYKPSTIYDNTGGDGIPDLPFPVYVVDSTTSQDGLGNSYTVTNTYQGGLYNAQEREFRGFNYVTTKDALNNYSEKYFYQDNAYKGLPYRLTSKDSAGNLYTKVENTYQNTNPYPGVNFPHLSQQDSFTYDGDTTYKQAKANYTYDSYGNVTILNNHGDVSITTDDLTQTTEYSYNTTKWILSKVSHSYTTHDSQGAAKVREGWFYYDNNTSYTQPPTYGDLTKEERWLNGGTNPIVQYQYDTYGNLTSTTDPRNNTTTIGYDTATYTFPITYTNPLSHVQSYTYDAETGQVLTSQDPNNAITTNVYDTFKRPLKVIGPNDTETSPLITYAYDLTTNPTKVTITQKTGGEPYTTYVFADGLGRQIETKTPAEDPTKQIVTGIVKFNNRALLQEAYLPYYTTLTTGYTTPDYLQPKTSYTYDAVGRLTRTTNPDSTYSTTSYSDWTVTKTDENSHTMKYYNDAFGRMTKVEEYNGTNIYTTQYEYNAVGDLIKTIDNLNNQTTISYDTLSRKVNMTDPDMGPWTYTYDAAGNLLTQTDAKSQTITFTYDTLNRLTLKDYPTGTDVTYTYDLNTNGKGRLTQVHDTSGTTQFWYDNLGREIKSTKTIDSTPYTIERTYDSADRLSTIKYPDNEIITYAYNLQGQVETVTSCIASIDYSATGQITRINYVNGTSTDYTYNPNTLRLSTLKTNNGAIQNLSYGFDNAGNVTSIQDILNARTQTLTYDDLNRLITATGGYGTKNYSYNSIGNILTKDGLTYTYGTKPHAVTSTSDGTNYIYDANGNMTAKGTSTYTYDYDNRLTQVTATGGTTTFVYDGDGGRVKKTTLSGTTVYLGSLYEVTGSTARKYIFVGPNRIQIKESTGNVYYIHSDHLGSSNVVTDGNATTVQKLEYTPFGTIWNSTGSDITKHKYTGKELDDTTGLYFYGARYYDASLGRFITADPTIQRPFDPQDLNRYTYCRNNPITYTDPTGLGWFSKLWDWFKDEVLQPLISFVAAVVAVWLVPSFAPLIAKYGFWAVAGTVGASSAGATATLDTGEGRQFMNHFAKEFFDDILGMSPRAASFFSSLVSHTLLASAYYTGISHFTMSPNATGPDYSNTANQGEISKYGLEGGDKQPGGSTSNYIRDEVEKGTDIAGKFEWKNEGLVASDIAFKGTPGVEQTFSALNARHAAAVVNVNGKLWDSAFDIQLKGFPKYGFPWAGISHQAFYNTVMSGGMSSWAALGAATSHAGWSFYLSSSLYGINAGYGMSGIIEGGVQMDRK